MVKEDRKTDAPASALLQWQFLTHSFISCVICFVLLSPLFASPVVPLKAPKTFNCSYDFGDLRNMYIYLTDQDKHSALYVCAYVLVCINNIHYENRETKSTFPSSIPKVPKPKVADFIGSLDSFTAPLLDSSVVEL
ncbi:hypothetical protein WUBG_01151 [Wuchereria bancrofti]|uniref:Uncharacterized protein n=1 Tax=Wuchereria bancrofti TaxID=6293 RepID=J9F0D1_WUCBA|nr:hypothetical protein WUBG_01151 [Wuchereria bancrofti]